MNSKSNYTIKQTTWQADKDALCLIREHVFIHEQSVPASLEWDTEDESAMHFLAVNASGEPVGTARLLSSGKIGRMAVLSDWRQKGIGSALLKTILGVCRLESMQPFLEAQTHAVEFYQPAGFEIDGAEFMDAGIPHFRMHYQAAQDKTHYHFDGRTENKLIALQIIDEANRFVRIMTPDLEHSVYDQTDFICSLTRLATSRSHSRIHILVRESRKAVNAGHRIIELARKLSSSIFLHNPPRDLESEESLLLADRSAFLQKKNGLFFSGKFCMHDPLQTRELEKQFDEIWERSQPDPELRRLYL